MKTTGAQVKLRRYAEAMEWVVPFQNSEGGCK